MGIAKCIFAQIEYATEPALNICILNEISCASLTKCQEPGDVIFYSLLRARSLPAFGGIPNLKFQSWVPMSHDEGDTPILRLPFLHGEPGGCRPGSG